jgi:hypothetical protein
MITKPFVAYLETLMLASPYMAADDRRIAGKCDLHFNRCMERLRTIPDERFNQEVSKVMTSWFQRFPPAAANRRTRTSTGHAGGDEPLIFNAATGLPIPAAAFGQSSDDE